MVRIENTDLNYYEVGGSVRDRLLGIEPSDHDFVIVGHTVDDVVDAGLERVVGEDFPVFLDGEGKECAMARTEEKVSEGHQGFEIHTSPDVTLEEDLSRRDITINSMAIDPETGDIIDPFDGQEDLQDQRIRHTTDAFREDPLRVLRAARFAATLPDTITNEDNGWEVDGHTMAMCRQVAPKLRNISEERIADEVLKAMKRAQTPSTFFRVLADMDALDVVLPELTRLRTVPAGPREHHREGTAYEHTLRVLDHAPDTLRCRLAALAHDVGKGRTPVEDWPNHYGHDKEGGRVAERIASRLKLSNEHTGVMVDAAEQHMRMMKLREMGEGKVIDLVERLDRSSTHIDPEELLALCDADGLGREPQTPLTDEQRRAFPYRIKCARAVIDCIGGEEVLQMHEDKEPGEWVGDRIHQLRVETMRDMERRHPSKLTFESWTYQNIYIHVPVYSCPGDVREQLRDDLWDPVGA